MLEVQTHALSECLMGWGVRFRYDKPDHKDAECTHKKDLIANSLVRQDQREQRTL